MYGHCTHLSAGRARWTCGKLNTGKPGFTWGTGRRKLGSLFGAQNLYPCVFTAGKTTIKKTKKVWRQTKSQSVEEQLDLVNFYLRSAIINGVFLSPDKHVKDTLPTTTFSNMAFQKLVDGVDPVTFKLDKELNVIRTCHKELGLLDPGWTRSKKLTGSLEDLEMRIVDG